ncbi:MAG: type II toxin-antitoxin system prevent-host-death family antitoxin [Candidatus Acidiferrum sp.]
MRQIGLFEAKQKLSELVERAGRGERIGITKRGKLTAVIGPAENNNEDIDKIFDSIENIRRKVKRMPGVTMKELINEGRKY